MKKQLIILLAFTLCFASAIAQQTQISIATDFDIQRSFKKEQRYWAVGQTTTIHFHFSPTDGAYAWLGYFSNGKFKNDLTAIAKSATTTPQQLNYVNNAQMRFKHFSIGWKHYFKGTYDNEDTWNLYGYAGLGLMLGRVINEYSIPVDTSAYSVPVISGKANFKRLTLDLGLGWEKSLGAAIFFYNEARVWVPTTDYPSTYIFVNRNAPLMASLNFGIRILLD